MDSVTFIKDMLEQKSEIESQINECDIFQQLTIKYSRGYGFVSAAEQSDCIRIPDEILVPLVNAYKEILIARKAEIDIKLNEIAFLLGSDK